MDSRIKTELEKSWAPTLNKYVLCNIDEKTFSVLYSDTGSLTSRSKRAAIEGTNSALKRGWSKLKKHYLKSV
ncbi:hypothetical protein L1766_02045 [Thermovorax subterraneus]|nr:hypothetical protein [Thermovorax subterraneus]